MHDIDGNECALGTLCRKEPERAASWIRDLVAKLAAAEERAEKAEADAEAKAEGWSECEDDLEAERNTTLDSKDQCVGLAQERDALRAENAQLREERNGHRDEIEAWKDASGLDCVSGDPSDVTPKAMEKYWLVVETDSDALHARVEALEAELNSPGLLEQLADLEHERWAGWQRYLYGRCVVTDDGLTIGLDDAKRWARQIDTPYAKLSEREKESDRKEARKSLEIIKRAFMEKTE